MCGRQTIVRRCAEWCFLCGAVRGDSSPHTLPPNPKPATKRSARGKRERIAGIVECQAVQLGSLGGGSCQRRDAVARWIGKPPPPPRDTPIGAPGAISPGKE